MIYFIRAGDGDCVKIGWTKDQETLERRIGTLQVGQHLSLAVVRTMEAPRWVEGWLHCFFAGAHVTGEWFRFQDEMLSIVPPDENPSPQPKDIDTTKISPLALRLLRLISADTGEKQYAVLNRLIRREAQRLGLLEEK